MNSYISFELIKKTREQLYLTQAQLAEQIGVSEKTISKWETKRGMPDISLLPSIANALGLSVSELICGKKVENGNKSANMLKMNFYVCPVCGNVVTSVGEVAVSCCGVELIKQESETAEGICREEQGELFVSVPSPMKKDDYVSFIAYVTGDKADIVKLYPEQSAEAIFTKHGRGYVCYYDIKNGLYRQKV